MKAVKLYLPLPPCGQSYMGLIQTEVPGVNGLDCNVRCASLSINRMYEVDLRKAKAEII